MNNQHRSIRQWSILLILAAAVGLPAQDDKARPAQDDKAQPAQDDKAQPAQDYKAILGQWSMTSETDDEPVKWNLSLREADGKLAAFLVSEQGEQPAQNTTYAEGVLKFKATYQDNLYDIELRLKNDKLEGTWSGDGNSGQTSGVRH